MALVVVAGVPAAVGVVTAGSTVAEEGVAVAACAAGAAGGEEHPAARGRSIRSRDISGIIRGTRCLPNAIGFSGILELFGSNLVIVVYF